MICTGFAWQLPRPIQEWQRVKGSFWWQTKGSIIYRKWVSPHQEGRGCKWHVNKTWWASCMGSWHPQSLGHVFHLFKLKEQRPSLQSGNCFHPRLHLSVYELMQICRVWMCMYVCTDQGWVPFKHEGMVVPGFWHCYPTPPFVPQNFTLFLTTERVCHTTTVKF